MPWMWRAEEGVTRMSIGYEVSVRFRSRRLSRFAFAIARLLFRNDTATRIEWFDRTFIANPWPPGMGDQEPCAICGNRDSNVFCGHGPGGHGA
jgi:hypothetical protein